MKLKRKQLGMVSCRLLKKLELYRFRLKAAARVPMAGRTVMIVNHDSPTVKRDMTAPRTRTIAKSARISIR